MAEENWATCKLERKFVAWIDSLSSDGDHMRDFVVLVQERPKLLLEHLLRRTTLKKECIPLAIPYIGQFLLRFGHLKEAIIKVLRNCEMESMKLSGSEEILNDTSKNFVALMTAIGKSVFLNSILGKYVTEMSRRWEVAAHDSGPKGQFYGVALRLLRCGLYGGEDEL